MRNGQIRSKFAITVPTVFIDPTICRDKEGNPDSEVVKVLDDLWKNYDVNIRYLHVTEEGETKDFDFLIKNFSCTYVHPFDLLKFLQPDIIACFFGERDLVPVNHKVYSKYQLVNEYSTILSSQKRSRVDRVTTNTRYKRRRDV